MKKHWYAIPLAALLALSGVFSASAEGRLLPDWTEAGGETETDYEGLLDIVTGEPVFKADAEESDRIVVGGGEYDVRLHRYFYPVGSAEVGMTLPNGGVTTQKVALSVPDGLPVQISRSGNPVTVTDNNYEFTEVGAYVVTFGADNDEELVFTVVGEVTGMLYDYTLPAGFTLTSLTVNAQEMPVNTNLIDMSEEGRYSISYRCVNTGVTHDLNVTVDHTPPTLALEAVKDGFASGPVDISDLEKGAAISIFLNGDSLKYAQTLTQSGTYRIIIADKAGNKTTYNFVIRVYNNASSYVFFVILIGMAAALTAYIVLSRRKLRVR